jgi:cation diffusion facilitator family transporter
MNIIVEKKSVAILSIVSNSTIIFMKLFAGIISGSISVISEAIHSMSDLLASILTYFSVVKSSEPADKKHPFGHGKYEDLSGFIEGCLIVLAALFIFYEAFRKILTGKDLVVDTTLGLYVMGLSSLINVFVSSSLFKVAKRSESISLYADAQHLRTDIWSSLGIFLGLLAIKLTNIYILDPIIAIIVGSFVFKAGLKVSRNTMDNLLNSSLPEDELNIIREVLNSFQTEGVSGYKDLKACRVGPSRKVEVTLLFPEYKTILECHNICDKFEQSLSTHFKDISTSIHFEPENLSLKK